MKSTFIVSKTDEIRLRRHNKKNPNYVVTNYSYLPILLFEFEFSSFHKNLKNLPLCFNVTK